MQHPFAGLVRAEQKTDATSVEPAAANPSRRGLFGLIAGLLAAGTAVVLGSTNEANATTRAFGEEGGGVTTLALGEEGGRRPTTRALGEEGGRRPTTRALGEEGSRRTTMWWWEEGGRRMKK